MLPLTASISSGTLRIGGYDSIALAERFGTPLFVFDRATFETRARQYGSTLDFERVFYAAKAFCCVAVCELADDLGLGLDVCSGGELATALTAGFPPDRIVLHGNNKTIEELELARSAGVGRVVVDSFDEIERLEKVGLQTKLALRITPGIEANTHDYITTGRQDSKFGFGLADGVALRALAAAREVPGCDVAGIHAHLGSQIFNLDAFELAVPRIAAFLADARELLGWEARELNLGGGFGVAHAEDEVTVAPSAAVGRLSAAVAGECSRRSLAIPELFLEPGRSLVGQSMVSLYRVGTVKEVPGVRTYVSVDGGMADNIRPPLYGARYETFLANRPRDPCDMSAAVAGRFCESGDLLIKDARLPSDTAPGDLLCIPSTGAYTYSMASNFNRVPRPPVVMVDDGRATVIVEREGYADVMSMDRRLDGTPPTSAAPPPGR